MLRSKTELRAFLSQALPPEAPLLLARVRLEPILAVIFEFFFDSVLIGFFGHLSLLIVSVHLS